MADRTEEARILLKEAQKLAAQGKYSEALKLTDQVLSVKPDLAEVYVFDIAAQAEALTEEARILAVQGKYRESLQLTDQVLKIKPDHAEVYVYRGSLHVAMNDIEAAITEIREGEAIFEARNDLEKAAVMRQFADDLQESLDDGSWAEELEEERRIEEENAL
ncbi:MAG: tetratricopeptide repeat protein [Phormidesmis sp.]